MRRPGRSRGTVCTEARGILLEGRIGKRVRGLGWGGSDADVAGQAFGGGLETGDQACWTD